ncbi:hypothetical protein C922_02513 [Plasmodium inui San Antonio 1]|uniref:Uncharacterized protein n=1 Tax=Plasmodium inui San Antonio 1 TaxID=1237626 RepID=W7ACS9_9APIC|nr:hypothetical protein C922_02513 [Plasmodium inui San Antonio 1]EUD66929.1 hypothetical protein C922_02513 [Plasmodium inui San Antonio 1]
MEERLNLYFYPLQRLKIYGEPNNIEVALSPLKQTERGKEEGIESLNCRPVENPHMIYDSLNSNILNEIKNFYANDKVYHVVASTSQSKRGKAKGRESDDEGEEEENEEGDGEDADDGEEDYQDDDCYYTDGETNPDENSEALPTRSDLQKGPFGDETMSKKRDNSNKKQVPRLRCDGATNPKVSDRKRATQSCIDFLRNSRNYEKEIRRDQTRVRASLDVVNTLATFYIDKSMQLDSRYAYDLRFNVKCPVLVMPGGFYNNQVKLMEAQIGECIYDEGDGRGGSHLPGGDPLPGGGPLPGGSRLPSDYLPVNLQFRFDNEVTIVPTNLSTGNYDANERGILPTYYRYAQKVKLAKEYNRKRSYRNVYKIENNHLLYQLDRCFTEVNEKESIAVSKYLKIKEIKADTNNINESVIYARNDVGLVIFQVQYAPGEAFNWDGALWTGNEEEDPREERDWHGSRGKGRTARKSFSSTVGRTPDQAFPILDYKITMAKDILLFDRLMQICPSTWTYGRCTLLGNYNSLYSYDLETNLLQIVELKRRGGYFKNYDTALCLCYLQDDNTLLLGCGSLYIYDKREQFLSKFNTNNSGVKRVSKKTIGQKARDQLLTGIPLEMKTNAGGNIFHEDKNRSHFNRGYTAVAKNPDFSFIVASVNTSFNVIEVWDLRNQYEPVFLFPLNISEFTESHFRHIEWMSVTPTGHNRYEQRTTYNLVTFSYYEHFVYIRKILIRDDFTSYKDLGMEAYTNRSFPFAYNYTFKGEPSGGRDGTQVEGRPFDRGSIQGGNPPNGRSSTIMGYRGKEDGESTSLRSHSDDAEKNPSPDVAPPQEELRANHMQMREDIPFNHIFSYKTVKMLVGDSLLVDTAKFTPMQKNKTEPIRLISDHSKFNSINTKVYNLFFGLYGMKFVQLCVPVLYCRRQPEGDSLGGGTTPPTGVTSHGVAPPEGDSLNHCDGNASPREYLEERFYFDGKNTRTWKYSVKKRDSQRRVSLVRRQEIVGIKLDYVQFILHTNSGGQLFCTPVNLCVKNLAEEEAKGWIPINRSYVASTYRNEGLPGMLSRFADLVQNRRCGEETEQRGGETSPPAEATASDDRPQQLADSSPSPHREGERPHFHSEEQDDEFNFLNLDNFEGIMSNGVDRTEKDTHTLEVKKKKKKLNG